MSEETGLELEGGAGEFPMTVLLGNIYPHHRIPAWFRTSMLEIGQICSATTVYCLPIQWADHIHCFHEENGKHLHLYSSHDSNIRQWFPGEKEYIYAIHEPYSLAEKIEQDGFQF